MENQLMISVLITLIGMGLVFAAILLLWAVMALLVRLTADDGGPQLAVEAQQEAELALKQRAAVAAIAVALACEENCTPHEFPLPPTALVSPWQAVMRTKMLNKRGQVQ